MKDSTSIFIILSSDIIEICLSREDSNITKNTMDVSQFLILISSQYLLNPIKFSKSWKKWLFFVLQFALGENFRINSYRDYPIEKEEFFNLNKHFINEFEIKINVPDNWCSLRIDSHVLNKFLSSQTEKRTQFLFHKVNEINNPIDRDSFIRSVRLIDLSLVTKRFCFIKPDINELQLWIISWEPITKEELNIINTQISNREKIDFKNITSLIQEDEVISKGWNIYRDPALEQPYGLICISCETIYEPNLFAKKCNNCSSWLKKR